MVKIVLISALGVLIAFFALRGVMLWYWKVNEIAKKLDDTVAELRKISANRELTR